MLSGNCLLYMLSSLGKQRIKFVCLSVCLLTHPDSLVLSPTSSKVETGVAFSAQVITYQHR